MPSLTAPADAINSALDLAAEDAVPTPEDAAWWAQEADGTDGASTPWPAGRSGDDDEEALANALGLHRIDYHGEPDID